MPCSPIEEQTMTDIESVLKEGRLFAPPANFSAHAHVKNTAEYEALYRRSMDDPEGFWAEVARQLDWARPFTRVLDWKPPYARWFEDGQLNVSYNCLDRHLAKRGDQLALRWEGEPGETRDLTYRELHAEVCRFANALKSLGVKKGDRVAIYLPMIPEAAIAMLACTRIGAPHSVVFGGFSAEALRDRCIDAGVSVIITADGGYRRGKVVALKEAADRAAAEAPSVKHLVVVQRAKNPVDMKAGRDVFWHDLVATQKADCPAEPLDSEHPLFIL